MSRIDSQAYSAAGSTDAIARALGGKRAGRGWIARCPAHDDRRPSLSIGDAGGKPLVHCHAGCDAADVIAALRDRGLWPAGGEGGAPRGRQRRGRAALAPTNAGKPENAERLDLAHRIWRASASIEGSLAAVYLSGRGLGAPYSAALRCHASLRHPSGEKWPAMVALVQCGVHGAPMGVHRTFLARDGFAKAPIQPAKMMLGPCRGGAVMLAPAGFELMVGEGIETCLSAMQAANLPSWAALSTSGLRALDLPEIVRSVIVLADGDDPGEQAATHAARRWRGEGRRVRIARPPRGADFNDLLTRQRAGRAS